MSAITSRIGEIPPDNLEIGFLEICADPANLTTDLQRNTFEPLRDQAIRPAVNNGQNLPAETRGKNGEIAVVLPICDFLNTQLGHILLGRRRYMAL